MLIPKIWIKTEVRNSKGTVIQRTSEEGHSWVKNFYTIISMLMVDAGCSGSSVYVPIMSQSNGVRGAGYIWYDDTYGIIRANIGDTKGIRVGVGTAFDFDIDDYNLSGLVGHGNGFDQLYHFATTAPTVSRDYGMSGNVRTKYISTLEYKRTFANNSGNPMTITNVGIIGYFWYLGQGQSGEVFLARDVLSSPVLVPHGALLTISYSISSPDMLEVMKLPLYNAGTEGSGGYYYGGRGGALQHPKYSIVISPASGGLSSNIRYMTSTSTTIGATDTHYGWHNTQKLIALGAASPIGQFCAAANANKLGGYDDWYIPARYESWGFGADLNSYLPEGERNPIEYFWTSTESSSSSGFFMNLSNNSTGSGIKTNTYKIRLIRRILHREFIPKVE